MGEIVNLNRVRKAAALRVDEAGAAVNRAKFGRTGAEREAEARRHARQERLLDGAALDPPGPE